MASPLNAVNQDLAATTSVTNLVTNVAGSLSNLLLATPQNTQGYQPQSSINPNAAQSRPSSLLFHYEGEQTATLDSDITDHYVEDNTAIQDQWALKPIIITTHGFIGELNNIAPPGLATLQSLANSLSTLNEYVPVLSQSALIAYNEAFFLYQNAANAVNSAVSAWSTLSGTGGESVINGQGIITQGNQNKQQTMFQQLYGYWVNRVLFTVQTPWAVFQNMAIKTLRAIQSEETRMITDFELSFKMIRTATTATTPGLASVLSGRLSSQASGLVNNGTNTPVSSISVSTGLSNMGVT